MGWSTPPDIKKKYEDFRATIPCLEDIQIPQWIQASKETELEVHSFLGQHWKIYATHLFIPTEFISGYDGPPMGQLDMLES